MGVFLNLNMQQMSPGKVTWPRKVVSLGSAGSYVLGSTGQGQIDVFSFRDMRNCQTLALEGTTVAMCSAPGGRVLIAGETSITCLDLVPFDRQMQKLLIQMRISDALDLLNATFGPEDPERGKQLSRFHALAGWAYFRDLQFSLAFQHFVYSSDFRIVHALMFWQSYLPSGFDIAASTNCQAPYEGTPVPCEMKDFIRKRLLEQRPLEGGDSSSVHANVELANGGMAAFLLKQREALQAEERLPAEQRTLGGYEPGALLKAVDTVLLKLLVESDPDDTRLQELLKGGVRCRVEDCEEFLRKLQRIDVIARLWKEQGAYELVLQEWSSLLNCGESAGAIRQGRKGPHLSTAQIVKEMCSALKGASSFPGAAELLRKYIPQLLAIEPSAILPIFTATPLPGCAGQFPLASEEVLRLLHGYDSIVLGYLEHLVLMKKNVEPHCRAQLALIYISQVADELKNSTGVDAGISQMRQKLLQFLEETEDLDVRALLPRIEELGLHEENVVLSCREQQHEKALRVLVEVFNDLPRAESYCRIVMANQQRRPAVPCASGSAVAAGISIFSADLPTWARGIVFRPRRPEDDEAAVACGISSARSTEASAKPLKLLLGVLLQASSGAEQAPGNYPKIAAEYREAALSLLVGYAGHGDLPPHEVIGMLPASWTLESLAGYLTKCARICLHERRASMLEENLSSMAYLKTFSAWAHERIRKVNITGDRCCPVCNRRFVDKDSVGKAFVAYPNETCVHLQCKEDLSVCPKTGRSFADNLSVYCNALGVAPEKAL